MNKIDCTSTFEVVPGQSVENSRIGKWWGWDDFAPGKVAMEISTPVSEEATGSTSIRKIAIHPEKLRSLVADLTAAEWVESNPEGLGREQFLRAFLELHEQLLAIIERKRPNIFRSLTEDALYEIAIRWCSLFRATLSEHRRVDLEANDLSRVMLDGKEWGILLKLGRDALLTIEYPARFAEFWAERSVRSEQTFESYEHRVKHVGSRRYHLINKLTYSEELLVLDQFSNGVPSYDIFLALGRHNKTSDIAKSLQLDGWNVVVLTERARRLLHEEAYAGSAMEC